MSIASLAERLPPDPLGGGRLLGLVDDMGLSRITDEEIRRERAFEMLKMKLMGIPKKKIARKYRITPRHVNREIAFLPEEQRAMVHALR